MSDLTKKIADFFKERDETHPNVRLPARKGLGGLFEAARIGAFQSENLPFSQKTGKPWSELSGEVYKIASLGPSVIIAVYEDSLILWLDDHSNDSDFAEFIKGEGLLTWLPERMVQLAELVIETKLNYIGDPRLVRSTSDIPTLAEIQKDHQALSKNELLRLESEEKQLA